MTPMALFIPAHKGLYSLAVQRDWDGVMDILSTSKWRGKQSERGYVLRIAAYDGNVKVVSKILEDGRFPEEDLHAALEYSVKLSRLDVLHRLEKYIRDLPAEDLKRIHNTLANSPVHARRISGIKRRRFMPGGP